MTINHNADSVCVRVTTFKLQCFVLFEGAAWKLNPRYI